MKRFVVCAAFFAAVLLLAGCSGGVSCDENGVRFSTGIGNAVDAGVDTRETVARMEKLAPGIIMYTIDHDDNLPELLSDVVKEGYVDDAKLVKDPISGKEFGYVARTFQHSPIEKPEEFPMAFALYPEAGVAVVLYADKHADLFPTKARNAGEFVEAMHAAHPYDEDTIRVMRINARGK